MSTPACPCMRNDAGVRAPVTPGSRREHRAWYFYDWASSAFSTTVVTVFFGPYLTSVAQSAAQTGEQIRLLGLVPVTAESYLPYTITISVLLQVVLLPIIGAVADRSERKRRQLGIWAGLGGLATMTLFLVHGTGYQLGGVLFVIANVAFGAAAVVYNSFLPDIATPEQRDGVSSRGWALGYVGGILLLVINLALYLGHSAIGLDESMAVRISLLSAGLWWVAFTVIPVRGLVDRPARGIASDAGVLGGFAQLGRTLAHLVNYRQALWFLLAFFFFNDGIQTVIGLAATYATEELGLGTTLVIAAVIIVQVVGIAGALLLGRAAGRWGAKSVVLGSLTLWAVVLVCAFFIPANSAPLFLMLAAFIGFVLGGSQALARSLFAQLIPRDREAEYFSLYEVSNGASSILGPLVFGLSLQFLGSYRIAILALVVFFVIGGAFLAKVDVARGQREAELARM